MKRSDIYDTIFPYSHLNQIHIGSQCDLFSFFLLDYKHNWIIFTPQLKPFMSSPLHVE